MTDTSASKRLPRINQQVLSRQTKISALVGSSFDKEGALEALVARREITLPPHPSYQLPVDIDWYADPFGQRNWCAQLHMLRWIRPLVRDVLSTGSEESKDLLIGYIRSWQKASSEKSKSPRFAWSDMIDAVRVFELLNAYPAVPEADLSFMDELLYEHGIWLAEPENLGHSNHAVWQHMALFVIGCLFDDESWIDLAKGRIERAFFAEYDCEGINKEAAPGYHLYNYNLWKDVTKRLESEGHSIEEMNSTLEMARKALVHFTDPDGNLVEFGDTGPKSHLRSLKNHEDVQYVLTKGAEGELPDGTSKVYKAGYAFSRSGWGENEKDYSKEFFLALRFGEIGVHGHNDIGSLLLHADGRRVLVDGGKYAYVSDEKKRHILSRRAHSSLVIDELPELADVRYELVESHHSALMDDYILKGKPYEGVQHERRVIYVRGADSVIVIDRVSSRKNHVYKMLWQLNPQAKVKLGRRDTSFSIGSSRFKLTSLGKAPTADLVTGEKNPYMTGWYSPKWGELDPTPTVVQSKVADRTRFINVIACDPKSVVSIDSLPNSSLGVLINTGKGYFAVDAEKFPAEVDFSRDELSEPNQKLSISAYLPQILSSLGQNEHRLEDSIGKGLCNRLVSCTGYSAPVAEIIAEELSGEQTREVCDGGKNAALMDLIAYILEDDASLFNEIVKANASLREPVKFSTLERSSAADSILESKENAAGSVDGVCITGEHALRWTARRGNRTLLVRFNGAIDRSRVNLPYFGGANALFEREESSIVFSDPALDRNQEMRLSWYLGVSSDGQLIYDKLNEVVTHYVEKWDIEEVVFFGTSGGGYAALQVGLRRGKSKVLAINPQTVLENYFPNHFERARDSAFKKGIEAVSTWPDAFDARKLLKRESAKSVSITYVDNAKGDLHHHSKHFEPFSKAAAEVDMELDYVEVDQGIGHKTFGIAETNDELNRIVQKQQ